MSRKTKATKTAKTTKKTEKTEVTEVTEKTEKTETTKKTRSTTRTRKRRKNKNKNTGNPPQETPRREQTPQEKWAQRKKRPKVLPIPTPGSVTILSTLPMSEIEPVRIETESTPTAYGYLLPEKIVDFLLRSLYDGLPVLTLENKATLLDVGLRHCVPWAAVYFSPDGTRLMVETVRYGRLPDWLVLSVLRRRLGMLYEVAQNWEWEWCYDVEDRIDDVTATMERLGGPYVLQALRELVKPDEDEASSTPSSPPSSLFERCVSP
ncbi:hypothetical protein Q8F55_001538 [Vanrija albida]|uniref:Uncharacterized protein n=1 Tax=Vanrija albida TaxID=181172 RepID=A0ABR3QGB7_9TREE